MGSNPAQCEIMRLTHICQQWRQIALSTPSLWNHIGVEANRSNVTLKVECVNAWLTRTKDSSLSVKIGCRYQHAWNAILDVFLPHSCGWRNTTIAGFRPADFSRVQNKLELLETFNITARDAFGEATEAFEIAPMLRKAHVHVKHHAGYRRVCQLPWPQLSSFEASHCSSEHALAVVQMMPNIISFIAQLFGESNSHALINYPLRLSKLETLKLSYGDGIDHFLDRLELPSLTEFTFWEWSESTIATPTGWSTSLISLIRRFACQLKPLALNLRIAPRDVRTNSSMSES